MGEPSVLPAPEPPKLLALDKGRHKGDPEFSAGQDARQNGGAPGARCPCARFCDLRRCRRGAVPRLPDRTVVAEANGFCLRSRSSIVVVAQILAEWQSEPQPPPGASPRGED